MGIAGFAYKEDRAESMAVSRTLNVGTATKGY
jgi:hypothetical protein